MKIISHVGSILGPACLVLFLGIECFADCAFLDREQAIRLAEIGAANQFNKGVCLGASIILIAINIYLLVKQRRMIFLTLFVVFGLFIQLIIIIGDAMASECGFAGASWTYFAYEFFVLATILLFLIVTKKWYSEKEEDHFTNLDL